MRSEAFCHTSGIERHDRTAAAIGPWAASLPPCIARCIPARLDDQRTRNRTHYRARHNRSVDSARPCEIPHTPPPAGRTGIRWRGTPAGIAVRGHRDRSRREQQPGDSSAQFCLIFDPVLGHPALRSETHVPVPFPDFVEWRLGAVAFIRFGLDPVAATCGGQAFVVPVWS